MRHRKKLNHLSRKTGHRRAMLANMASSLILHKRIRTTTAKAKALRVYVEPLITKSKEDSTHSRRTVFSYLQSKDAVTELFREVAPKIVDRPGGYTRILKTGIRLGDAADMCFIELVDYNESLLAAKEDSQKKTTRRSRRGGKKKSTGAEASAATDTKTAEKPEEKNTSSEEMTGETIAAEANEAPATEDKKSEETPAEPKEEAKQEENKAEGENKQEDEKKEDDNKKE